MAASGKDKDVSSPPQALDRFQIFITQIALELTSVDTKILKSLVRGDLPGNIVDNVDIKEKLPALDLISKLQEYCIVSPNNLKLFKQALDTCGRKDLGTKVEEFEKTVTELRDVRQLQIMEVLSDTVLLRLLLSDPKRSEELTQKTNSLRESICKKLVLEIKNVGYLTKEEASIPDCVFIVFQFPNQEAKIMELNCAALDKAEWLVSLGVLQLQIGEKATIKIKENLQDIRPIPSRQTSILAVNSNFAVHKDDTSDVILGIELLSFVGEDVGAQLRSQCQSALKLINQNRMSNDGGFDMKLGEVTFGNHFNTQQPIAFASEGLSEDFDAMENTRQCLDGDGCSGMADALNKVLELKEDVRKEATKVCIMLTFLNQKSCDPKHYRCSHGNDIIKHCNDLGKNGITLYVIGIHTELSLSNEENHFLSGVARISGGLYLEVCDLHSLDEIIACIIKHDVSIEKHGKFICEALIDEINRKYGIVNIKHLAKYLKQTLNQKDIRVDGFQQNGEFVVVPISPIAERVAMADDLEDAINAVEEMSKRFKTSASRERSRDNLRTCLSVRNRFGSTSKAKAGVLTETAEWDRSKMKSDVLMDTSEKDGHDFACLVENETVDLEVASRIVKRQLHRLEYHKINEEQEMEH